MRRRARGDPQVRCAQASLYPVGLRGEDHPASRPICDCEGHVICAENLETQCGVALGPLAILQAQFWQNLGGAEAEPRQ